jgi:hypothetical protein
VRHRATPPRHCATALRHAAPRALPCPRHAAATQWRCATPGVHCAAACALQTRARLPRRAACAGRALTVCRLCAHCVPTVCSLCADCACGAARAAFKLWASTTLTAEPRTRWRTGKPWATGLSQSPRRGARPFPLLRCAAFHEGSIALPVLQLAALSLLSSSCALQLEACGTAHVHCQTWCRCRSYVVKIVRCAACRLCIVQAACCPGCACVCVCVCD